MTAHPFSSFHPSSVDSISARDRTRTLSPGFNLVFAPNSETVGGILEVTISTLTSSLFLDENRRNRRSDIRFNLRFVRALKFLLSQNRNHLPSDKGSKSTNPLDMFGMVCS
jgi:hypothetical protein